MGDEEPMSLGAGQFLQHLIVGNVGDSATSHADRACDWLRDRSASNPRTLLTYVFRSQSYQVLVNGSTGRIAGKYPLSAWKIFFAVVAVLLAAVLFILASEG